MKKSYLVLLHLAYWGGYLLILTAVMVSILTNIVPTHLVDEISAIVYLMGLVPAVGAFYSSYSLIFKKFLQRKRVAITLLGVAAAALLAALAGDVALCILKGPSILFADGMRSALEITVFMMLMVAVPNALLGLGMRAFVSWFDDIQTKQELEEKNHAMEMALIKAQINPHFLFNTIANIDVLIAKDPTTASAYLNKLSGIMRFMLYETQAETIPLRKELDYIEQYIALQKIRYSNPDQVQFSITGNAGNQMIAPMIFIPFIENAFKFAESKKSDPAIHIRFEIQANKVEFQCENNFQPSLDKSSDSGLGNALIEKRLALLYPQKHTLQSTSENGHYRMKLSIATA
jgi:two-component system, LytTR family, sensor kinase